MTIWNLANIAIRSSLCPVNYNILKLHQQKEQQVLQLTLFRQLVLNHLDLLLHFLRMLLNFLLCFRRSVPKCSLLMGFRLLDVLV
jgi:hypothetical protein